MDADALWLREKRFANMFLFGETLPSAPWPSEIDSNRDRIASLRCAVLCCAATSIAAETCRTVYVIHKNYEKPTQIGPQGSIA